VRTAKAKPGVSAHASVALGGVERDDACRAPKLPSKIDVVLADPREDWRKRPKRLDGE